MGLFHDGQVRAEIGIEYFVESDPSKRCRHLAFHVCSHRIAELFSERRSDCRSGLYDHMLRLVRDRLKDIVDVALLIERSCRTCRDTLTASHTAGISQPHLERGSDKGSESSVVRSDDAHALHLLAHCGAAAAEDTFIVVAHHMYRALVQLIVRALAFKIILVCHAQLLAECLKLALSAAHAGETFLIMIGQEKLQRPSSGIQKLLRVRLHFHPLRDRMYTRCHKISRTLYFHNAHTACADLIDLF